MLGAIQRPKLVLGRGHDDLREEPLHTVLVSVAVVPDLPLDEDLRTLRQPLGRQPADRALVPDLDLVPGRVVLPLAGRLRVAVGGDPEGGDLLAA